MTMPGVSQKAGTYGATIAILALVVILSWLGYQSAHIANADTSGHIEVRWLLSHQPTAVFSRATKVFAEELSKETQGRLVLTVVTPQDIGIAKGDVPNARISQLLDSGEVQLASAYTVALGKDDPEIGSLNLPLAFDSYAQLPAILDGATGQALLAGIAKHSSARGLAFTMSGGFRIIATKDIAIHSLKDLKGLHIATSGGPVAEATLKALGAVPVPLDLESGNAAIDTGTIDGVETTLSRLSEVVGSQSPYTRYINETDHSVFLTAILASNSFYASLSREDQQSLTNAALAAAQAERSDSIELGNSTRQALESEGSVVTPLSPDERARFKAAVAPVYAQFAPVFGRDLMQAFTPGN